MSSPKKQPCKVCAGSGQVWLPMSEGIAVFYGEEVRQAVARGEIVKTVFRCDDCHGTGAVVQ